MRFEVPQFIDIEDQIFGQLTWKQFVYLAGGAGAAFLIWAGFGRIGALLFGLPILAFSAGLAFYKVNNRPMSLLVESMFDYVRNPKLYLWKQNPNTSVAQRYPQQNQDKIEEVSRSINQLP